MDFGDALAPGLVLRVTQRGVKSWSVIYKVPGERGLSETGRALKGTQHRITLGQYPAKGVEAARAKARSIMETVLKGQDPRADRATVLRTAPE